MYGDEYNHSYGNGSSRSGGYGQSSYREQDESGSDKSGELLGGLITLPSNIAPIANFFKNTVKPYIVEQGEDLVRGNLPAALKKTGLSEATAYKASARVSTALAYFIIFSDELAGTYQNVSQFIAGRKRLAEQLSPVLKAHGEKNILSAFLGGALSHNEVVDVARNRLRGKWVQDTFTDMSELAASLPTLYVRYANKRHELGEKNGEALQPDSHADRYRQFKEKMLKENMDADEIRFLWQNKVQEEGTLRQRNTEDLNKTREHLDRFIVPGGAAVAEFLRGHFIGREKKSASKTTALEMIRNLSDTVINDKEATSMDGTPFEAYIRKIFETHQENMQQPHIGKRFDEKMDYACKEIVSAITEGKMHPMALVNLVGERKIVRDKGKHIASREEIKQALSEQIKLMPAKFAVDPEEYIAEASVSEQDLKLALKDLKDNDRAFFISLLPEDVAKKLGLSEDEIKAAHETAKAGFAHNLSQAVLDLATLSDEKLKAAKLSDAEIALIRELTPKAKEGQDAAVLEAVGKKGEFKDTLDTVIVEAMGAGIERHPGELFEKAGKQTIAPVPSLTAPASEGKDGWGALDHKDHAHAHEDDALQDDDLQEDRKPDAKVHHALHQGTERGADERMI